MDATLIPLPMKDAVAFFKDKVMLGPAQFRKLSDEAKLKAFAVSGIAKGQELETVFNALLTALEKGTTIAEFKKECAEIFDRRGWTGIASWRVDNIFRTNIQTAYNVGRYRQMTKTVETRPYWMYDAVNDRRTRPAHRAMDGKTFPAGHPVWNTWYPPNGFRCRCGITTLSEVQVRSRGITVETEDPTHKLIEITNPKTGITSPAFSLMPDPGFSYHPGKAYWKAEMAGFSPQIRQEVLADMFRSVRGSDPDGLSAAECFKRLKRHLTPEDLELMQTVVWLETARVRQGYGEWVTGVMASMQPKGELYPMGNLPIKVTSAMEKPPRLSLVVIDDVAVTHLVREVKRKRGKALTPEEVAEMAERLSGSDWYLDLEDPAVIMTWVRSGDELVKMVIRTDRKIGKGVANQVVTAGIIKAADIRHPARYKKI